LKVRIDEGLPRSLIELLRQRGYDPVEVTGEGLGGRPDEDVWGAAQRDGTFLLTGDKEFANIRLHPPGTHAGVLLLRPDLENHEAFCELLRGVLDVTTLEDLDGQVAVASPRGLRVAAPR
jgi:predicted nuclease of predicted toxin-antitoxin system